MPRRSILKLSFFALTGLLVVGNWTPAQAGGGGANILIVAGTDGIAQTAATNLNTDLSGANTVTIVNTGVPGSLAGYTQIYDLRYANNPAFSVGEMNQYLTFLNAAAGNTIFLMGENGNPFFAARDTAISQFIALAGGGTIAAPTATSEAPETIHPPFTGPNVISTITYAACGLVTSSGSGAFASSEAGGGCALFFGTGGLSAAPNAALVVVYDVNFIYSAPSGGGAVNEIPFRLNLEAFAAAPTAAPPPMSSAPAPSSALLVLVGGCGLIAFEMVRRRKPAAS